MQIRWLGHAAFLIEGESLKIITDPYDPEITHLEPIDEPADVVIRSSSDDRAHCFIDTIPEGYTLLTATDYVEPGKTTAKVGPTVFHFMPSQESLIHKKVARENAFYRFELEGIKLAHLGDVGNKLTETQLSFLEKTQVLLVPAGGPPTIDLDDLMKVIERVQAKIVIPMHFRIPGPKFFMLPIEEFSGRFNPESVKKIHGSKLVVRPDRLPSQTMLYILEPSMEAVQGG